MSVRFSSGINAVQVAPEKMTGNVHDCSIRVLLKASHSKYIIYPLMYMCDAKKCTIWCSVREVQKSKSCSGQMNLLEPLLWI